MTDDATYRKMKQERDLALAECERLRADAVADVRLHKKTITAIRTYLENKA